MTNGPTIHPLTVEDIYKVMVATSHSLLNLFKGKHIGRAKKRDSDLIRKLLKAKVTYRRIAEIAKCSHGAVHAEVVALRKENTLQKQREAEANQKVLLEKQEIEKLIPNDEPEDMTLY